VKTSYPHPPRGEEPAHIHPGNIIINYKVKFCIEVANWPKYWLLNSNEANKEANLTPYKYNKINFVPMLPTVRNIGRLTQKGQKNIHPTNTKIRKIKFGTMLPAGRNIGCLTQKRPTKKHSTYKYNKINFGPMLPTVQNIGCLT
jgi:hypothetical protein